ncbi:MAG: hypothetical protein ACXVPN_14540 [Bacteroidia bacterium]
MKKRNFIRTGILSVLFAVSHTSFSQEKNEAEKHGIAITVGVGELKFFGTVGKNSDLNPMLDARLGYFAGLEKRFGKVLGVQLIGLYGKLAGTDNSPNSHLNFQSQIMQGHVLLTANFDKVLKNDPLVSPFLNIGIGYMMFSSYADLTNAQGDTLHYWSDGSTKNLSETYVNKFFAKNVDRDFNYETSLKTNGVTGTLVVPVGGGLNFNFGRCWTTSVGVNYNFCMTNWIDNTGKGSNSYLSASAALKYEFKKKTKEQMSYNDVDFAKIDHLDADKDGVPDDDDKCHGTPTGVAVDSKGCPVDTDNDGVADYLDKEPNSAKGVKVDGFGVTMNEKDIMAHQKEWADMAAERSKIFNVMPSAEYLRKIEEESKKAGRKKAKVIPENLKIADANHDGRISAAEITQIINSFFEGSNDVSIDTINRLIEFFFE